MIPRFSIQASLGLLLLAQMPGAQAQPADAPENPAPESRRAGSEAASPSLLELLEFIGEFTTEDGEWVDPATLLATDDSELAGTQDAADESADPAGNCGSPRCE